jgi:hypothetical protein
MKRFHFLAYDKTGALVDASDSSEDSLIDAGKTADTYYRKQKGCAVTVVDTVTGKKYSVGEDGKTLEMT